MSISSRKLGRSGKNHLPGLDNPNVVRVNGSATHALDGTNTARGTSELIRYTRTASQTVTPTNQYGVEIVVSLTTNQVLSVNDRLASNDPAGTPIPAGTYVLSGHGRGAGYAGQWLLDTAPVGAQVQLQTVVQDLRSFTAIAVSTTQITLDWVYSGAALVEFTLTRNGSTIATPAAAARTYTDSSLTPGTTYTYTLVGTYQAGGTTATLTATRATQSASGGTLPSKLVAAYWQMYQGPLVSEITANVPEYNLQYAAFALGNGSGGTASFNPAFQSGASFKTDMAASQAAGCTWLISIGGGVPAASQVMLRDENEATQLVGSLISICDEYGFDGIDFDLENGPGGWSPSAMASVAAQMKAHYGSSFIVSMAPRPYETFYFDTAVLMGNNVDLVGIQFYDWWQTSDSGFLQGWIRDKVDEVVGRGVPASKIMIGCTTYYPEYGNGANYPSVYRDAFLAAEAKYPDIRGVFVWESSLDKNKSWSFARTMGPAVL